MICAIGTCMLLSAASPLDADELNALGVRVEYRLPNAHWHLAKKQSETDRGMVLFFHDDHPSTDPDALDPSLAIIYERLPPRIRTAREYADYSQAKTSYPVAGQMDIGDCLLLFHRYEARLKNNAYRLFEVRNGIGIQYIGTATADRFEEFQQEVLDFIGTATCPEGKNK